MTDSQLTVRQFERYELALPVEFTVKDEQRNQVRFSSSSDAPERFGINGETVDLSPGGIGANMGQFVPRMCEGEIRILDPNCAERAILFRHVVQVRRVQMVDHAPTYSVGFAFVDPGVDLRERVEDVVRALNGVTGGAGGDHA